jgi:hypothetical protein
VTLGFRGVGKGEYSGFPMNQGVHDMQPRDSKKDLVIRII